jgi:hypothetical protein
VPPFVWAIPVLMFLSVVFLAVETPRYRTALDPFIVLLAAVAVTSAVGGGVRIGRRERSVAGPRQRSF